MGNAKLAQDIGRIELDLQVRLVERREGNADSCINFDFSVICYQIDRFVREIARKHLQRTKK